MSVGKQVRRENYEAVDEKTMELKVLRILEQRGRSCGEQVRRAMKTSNPNNVRPRLSTMKRSGKVAEVGKTANSQGRPETVYEITEKGKAALRGANTEDGATSHEADQN